MKLRFVSTNIANALISQKELLDQHQSFRDKRIKSDLKKRPEITRAFIVEQRIQN